MRVNPDFSADMVTLMGQAQQAVQTAAMQLSTGRRVNLPSDDPAAAAAMVEENTLAAGVDQFQSNTTSLQDTLNTANSTLNSVVTLMQKAITLGTEGGNGAMNTSNLTAIASEVSGIKSEMLSLANTSYAGSYLFGGTYNGGPPYSVNATDSTKVDYNGNNHQNMVQISTGLYVASNLPGSQIFSQTGSNVFDSLQALISALQSGNYTAVGAATTNLSTSLNVVSAAQAFYGEASTELSNNETYLAQEKLTITTRQDALVSADMATAATTLTQAQTALSASVQAAAKITQFNLLDYIR